MNATDSIFKEALLNMLVEIFDGPPGEMAFVLNPGDPGLLRQLESIDAATASTRPMQGKTTIASHTDHLHYGLSLMNRWAGGDANAFANSDWNASWKRTTVTDDQWRKLIANLRQEAEAWRKVVTSRDTWDSMSASGALSSAAHTAYHLGAIRQILAAQGRVSG